MGERYPADLHVGGQARGEQADAEQRHDREAVEDPLDGDRREHRAESGTGQPACGEDPHQLSRPKGQKIVGHEADRDRVPQRHCRVGAAIVASKQIAPADHSKGEGDRGYECCNGKREGRASRSRAPTSARLTPRIAQSRSPAESAIPMTAERIRRVPEVSGVGSGFGKCERDEVQEFLKKRLDRLDPAVPFQLIGELLPNGGRTFERRPAPVAEHSDLDCLDLG